jgi:Histidine kinase-, DNA gyrase B-, and HSP90-like ATPase
MSSAAPEDEIGATASEEALVASIRRSEDSDNIVQTTLRTDQRVIARVTDGIYRQPGSALRELISNAYDADATRVVIKTDAPRFERISVEDDGHGMTPEALAYLLLHIGGSAKRSDLGSDLGITSSSDPLRSPKGRRLIGKIGIGLFSVSQLTYSFQIITKTKGEGFRTVATVALRQYADDELRAEEKVEGKFESGKVNIWRERAGDLETHGTTIVLTSIRPQARDTLQSREIWSVVEQSESGLAADDRPPLEPPRYHIGRVDSSDSTRQLLKETSGRLSSLPWGEHDAPDEAFRKMVQCVWERGDSSDPNPQLERIFDYYLRMVWQLSLAVPLPYVEGHLFDMDLKGWAEAFRLSNQPKGPAEKISLARPGPIRNEIGLVDPVGQPGKFEIYFDEIQLFRPIKFKGLPTTSHALKMPLVFLGKCREEFSNLRRELSGGPLDFEAYLFWTPKVAPTDHQGSLIRIHGSSGTLFDPTFMRYQVSEQTRLRQITCEIFVNEGLDSALNIDRESFNNAHPHSIYITRWLHSALRQLATAQKRLAGDVREQTRDESKDQLLSQIQVVAQSAWEQESGDSSGQPPTIELADTVRPANLAADSYVFSRSTIMPPRQGRRTGVADAHDAIREEQLKAIAQVLVTFGLLERLPNHKQEELLRAIYAILVAPEEK